MTSDEMIIELQKLPSGTKLFIDSGKGYNEVHTVDFPDREKTRDNIKSYDLPLNAAELSPW